MAAGDYAALEAEGGEVWTMDFDRPHRRSVIGWNTDKIGDPLAGDSASGLFAPEPFAGQPARVEVPGVTHVYDSLVQL